MTKKFKRFFGTWTPRNRLHQNAEGSNRKARVLSISQTRPRDPVGLNKNDQRRVLGEDSVAGDQPHGFGHGLSHQHVIKRIVVVPG